MALVPFLRGLGTGLTDVDRVAIAAESGGARRADAGWLPSFSGQDELLWAMHGVQAVVALSDLSSPVILKRLQEALPTIREHELFLLGREPVERIDQLHNEMTDVWEALYDARTCWRAAFALAHAAPFPQTLLDYTKMANHLIMSVPWFQFNKEDVRKALGRLAGAWTSEERTYAYRPVRYQVAIEALHRGFGRDVPLPVLENVDGLFDMASNLDISGRRKFAGLGVEYDELSVRLD
jgi:hypothetical protein